VGVHRRLGLPRGQHAARRLVYGRQLTVGNWTFSGPNALDGTTTNPAAGGFPAGTYTQTGGSAADTRVQFSSASAASAEDGGAVTVDVTLTNPSATQATTVTLTASGTATATTDYTVSPTSLTFAAGSSAAQTVTIMPVEDGAAEGDETVVLTLGSVAGGTNAAVGTPSVYTLTLSDPAPSVQFASASATAYEDGGAFTVTVELTNPPATASTVDVALTGGTATDGTDFASFSTQTLTFAAGATSQTFTVTPTDDGVAEQVETAIFTLSNPGGTTAPAIGSPSTFTLAISDPVSAPGTIFSGQSGTQLQNSIQGAYTPTTLGYTPARDQMYGFVWNTSGTIEGLYTGRTISVRPNPSTGRADAAAGGFNAEHIWPQSQGAGDEPARSNLYNLAPTDIDVNSDRASLPFGEVSASDAIEWYRGTTEQRQTPTGDLGLWSRRSSSRFEPRDEVKGDIARSQFYFYTIYQDRANSSYWNTVKDVLYQWHQNDPVSAVERERHDRIAQVQGLSNPFVLDPTLAGRAFFGQTPPPSGDTRVSFARSLEASPENGGVIEVPVQITNPSATLSTTVTISVAGSATQGSDYTVSPTSLTFAAGSVDTQFVRITPSEDDENEPTETVELTISQVSGGTNAAAEAPSTYTLSLLNSNPAGQSPVVAIADARAQGDGARVQVRGVVSRVLGAFAYFQDGTAGLALRQTSGRLQDLIASGQIAAGDSIEVIGTLSSFNGLQQLNGNDVESITVIERGVGTPAAQLATLSELTSSGESFEAELVRVEGVTFDESGTFDERTSYTVRQGAASFVVRTGNAADTDLDGQPIPAGPATVVAVVTQFDSDGSGDGFQLLPIQASDVSDGTAAQPSARFAQATATVREDVGTFEFRVTLSNPTASAAGDVRVELVGGTATDGDDIQAFTAPSFSLAPGASTTGTVQVTILDDGVIEGNETLVFALTAPPPVQIAQPDTFTLTIQDFNPGTDDPELFSIAEVRALEDGSRVRFQGVVTRARGSVAFVDDGTAGLNVRQFSGPVADAIASGALAAGDSVEVVGTISSFNGLRQIFGSSLERIDVLARDVDAPQATDITVADLVGERAEALESRLVRVRGAFDQTGSFEANTSYSFSAGGASIDVRIGRDGDSELIGQPIPTQTVTISALVGQFDSDDSGDGYQLFVLDASDLAIASSIGDVLAEGEMELRVFPQPARTNLTIALSRHAETGTTLQIVNLTGRIVQTMQIRADRLSVPVDQLSSGVYLMRIVTPDGATALSKTFTVAR
jgi:hypothetical protein